MSAKAHGKLGLALQQSVMTSAVFLQVVLVDSLFQYFMRNGHQVADIID
jgi:hypothetical protein